MGSAEVGGKIFLTTNVLLKYEKVRISVKKDNNELMEHFFKLHSKWSQNAITVREELAMQYRSLEKAMKMDSTALMEHFLSLLIGESSTVKEEYPDESLDSLTSQPTQSVSIGEASTPPVMEYHNTSLSQDGSTSASPRNLVQIRDTALCSTSSNAAIKNPGALYTNNQSSCVPTVHIPLDSGVLLPHLSGTSSFSHTFSQKRKLSSSSDGDVPASKIPGIQHHIHHLHPPQSSGEPLQQESIPDRRSLIEGTTGQHLFGYQTGSTRNDYGKPSATFSLQDVEQQQNHGLRTAALPSDLSKDSRRDISKTALDFIEGVSQVTSVDNVHSLRLSVDRVSMGSIVGSEPLERQNVLGMNMSPQFAKGLRQNRVSMDNSVNIHPQPGTSGVNQNISGSMTEFDLSAVKIEINSDEDLEDVSHESGDQEALAAMVTDAGYSNSLEKQYSISKAGIYKAEIASMNGMVELVKGTNVYVHHDEYRTAINKSIPKLYKLRDTSQEILKDGKRIARYLMSIFFEKKELQERSLTNSELSRYPPLNQKIVSTILGDDMDVLDEVVPPFTPTSRKSEENEVSVQEMIPTPNTTEKSLTTAIDKKLENINTKLALVHSEQKEFRGMLTYIIQLLSGSTPTINGSDKPMSSTEIISTLPTGSSDTFSNIPKPYRIKQEELMLMKTNSHSVTHFACNILRRIFPELFGPDNLRLQHSYNGGRGNKTELDRNKKCYIQRYILYLYPEMSDPTVYKTTVVQAINECLRRPVERKRTKTANEFENANEQE